MSSVLRKIDRQVNGVGVNRRDRKKACVDAVNARKEAFKYINLACFDPNVNDAITIGAYEEFKAIELPKPLSWYKPELINKEMLNYKPGGIIGLDQLDTFTDVSYQELFTRMRANTVPAAVLHPELSRTRHVPDHFGGHWEY